jgi:hypothetical protein
MRRKEVGTDIYIQPICVISGLGREINEIFIALGRHAVVNSSFMPTFWDILLVGTGSISQSYVTAHKNADPTQSVRLLSAHTSYATFRQNIFNGLGDDIRRGVHLSMYLFFVYTTSVNSSKYTVPKRPDS